MLQDLRVKMNSLLTTLSLKGQNDIELNMKTDHLLPVLLAHFCSPPALKYPNSFNSGICETAKETQM